MTAQDSEQQSRAPQTVFATVAIAPFAYSAAVVALMHVFRPDLAPASHFVSGCAARPIRLDDGDFPRYGIRLSDAAVGTGPHRRPVVGRLARRGAPGRGFLGSLVAAIFPMDQPANPSTLTGRIHDIDFLVGMGSFSLALLLLTAGFWSAPAGGPIGAPRSPWHCSTSSSSSFVSRSTRHALRPRQPVRFRDVHSVAPGSCDPAVASVAEFLHTVLIRRLTTNRLQGTVRCAVRRLP